MGRKVLYPAVFVLLVLMSAPAVAATEGNYFIGTIETALESVYGVDGRVYWDPGTGAELVPTGALAQFIVARDGADIVDPLEYFDTEGGAGIDTPTELAAVRTWVNAGADPSDISSGTNKLMHTVSDPNWTGEVGLVNPGELLYDWSQDPNYSSGEHGPTVEYGLGKDLIAVRIWNLSKDELEDWCNTPGEQIWYMTDRELHTDYMNELVGGDPPDYPGDGGFIVGQGSMPEGASPGDYTWSFGGTIGTESLYSAWVLYEDPPLQMTLDSHLGTCPIPEPGTMLLIGSAALLLLIRRKK